MEATKTDPQRAGIGLKFNGELCRNVFRCQSNLNDAEIIAHRASDVFIADNVALGNHELDTRIGLWE